MATSWLFPPALNTTFRNAYTNTAQHLNASVLRAYNDTPIVAAIHNLSAADRVDERFRTRVREGDGWKGWGSKDAVVRVGDVIELDWVKGGSREVETRLVWLDCFVCKMGRVGREEVEGACDGYTNSTLINHLSNTSTTPLAPSSSYQIQTLETYFTLPNTSCAMCIFSLFPATKGPGLNYTDWSAPFPVLQEPSMPHKRFSAAWPTGSSDASISYAEQGSAVDSDGGTGEEGEEGGGSVAGRMIGVLGGLIVLVLLGGLVWRVWVRRGKGVVEGPKEAGDMERAGMRGGVVVEEIRGEMGGGVASQRARAGVVRRPESAEGDAPPPYHEAVRNDVRPG